LKRLLALVVVLTSPTYAATPVTGKWLNRDKDSIIEISQCGQVVCGRVAKILKPAADGGSATDRFNPNPALRSRPIAGLEILSGFTREKATWRGRIYDPRNGKSYKSFLTRNADGTLKVQGCIAFLCQTQTWTPAH
jgi:uncharacterized protein (DUF2147 family)